MGQDVKTPHHRQSKLEDRLIVQNGLDEAYSLNAIAKKIDKLRSTVSLKVCRNNVTVQKGAHECHGQTLLTHRQPCPNPEDTIEETQMRKLKFPLLPQYTSILINKSIHSVGGGFQISPPLFLRPSRVWGGTLRVWGRNP